MRISDWSSDVCSSDLLIGQSAESLTGQLLDDVAPELARLLTGEEREGIVQLSRKDAEPATLAAKAVAQGDGFVLSFEDITQQLLDQRRAAWSDVARRIAHRSEERSEGQECVRTC